MLTSLQAKLSLKHLILERFFGKEIKRRQMLENKLWKWLKKIVEQWNKTATQRGQTSDCWGQTDRRCLLILPEPTPNFLPRLHHLTTEARNHSQPAILCKDCILQTSGYIFMNKSSFVDLQENKNTIINAEQSPYQATIELSSGVKHYRETSATWLKFKPEFISSYMKNRCYWDLLWLLLLIDFQRSD